MHPTGQRKSAAGHHYTMRRSPVRAEWSGASRGRHPEWRLVAIEAALLGAILVFAVFLRYRGIEWGTGYYLHPDELFMTNTLVNLKWPTSIGGYFDSATSPLNPFNLNVGYVYGMFPLFATKALSELTPYQDGSTLQIPGRWLSAAADTGTVLLVWWIGRMLWNRWTGLLAALLLCCTPLHIGASHYFTTDAWSAFFAIGAFAFALASWRHRSWALYALSGLMVALAVSSKPTMVIAFGFLGLPILELIRTRGWRAVLPWQGSAPGTDEDSRFPVAFATILSLLVSVWAIRVTQPYTFQGPSLLSFRFDKRYLDTVDYWRNVQAGIYDYPPSIQWTDRAPIYYSVKNMVLWGMGPGLGLFALIGFALAAVRIATSRRWPSWTLLMPVGWVAFHLVFFGLALAKTARYLLPAYPFLILFAAAAMMRCGRWAWRNGRVRWPWTGAELRIPRFANPALILPVIAVATTVFYGYAFTAVYTHTQTRAAASVWMAENIPDGSTITNEYWDLGLPVGVPEVRGHVWTTINIAPYDDETPQKLTAMIGILERSDYIVLSSARLWKIIPRMPWRYPLATRYYEALFSGELGFEQVAHFTQYPEAFGIQIDDRSAEEALTVYDHPEVYIFKKTDRWDFHAAWYLLDGALGHGGINTRPVQTQPDAMLLSPDGQASLRSSVSWNAVFDAGSLPNRFPLLVWYLALQVIAMPIVPIAWRWLKWLPDRGYALSKSLGVFALGWLVWWLGSLHLMNFGLVSIVVAWLALFGAGVLAMRRGMGDMLADFSRMRWRIAATEFVFLGSLLIAAWLRSANPDLWLPSFTGSQLQDMAAFNAAALTPSFPAYDPWLSDGVIHGIGFGYVPWAVVTRVTSIVPEVAYSLTLASLVALVVLNAWQAGTLLAARMLRGRRGWIAPIIGVLTPVLVIGVGSWRMAQRIGANDWTPNYDGRLSDVIAGLHRGLTVMDASGTDSWIGVQQFTGPGQLEFPLLSYLTGEMNIQQLGLPLLLASLVLVCGTWMRDGEHSERVSPQLLHTIGGWRVTALACAVTGLLVGWTFAANPFFGIAAFLVAALAIALQIGAVMAWRSVWTVMRDTGMALGIVGVVALISALPFIRSYGYFSTARSPILEPLNVQEWLGHFGVVLAAVVVYLVWQTFGAGQLAAGEDDRGWIAGVAVTVLALAALGLSVLVGNVLILVFLLLALVGLAVWLRHDDQHHAVVVSMIAIALFLSAIANRTILTDWPPTQNLPNQFSLVVWVMLALVSVPIGAALVERVVQSRTLWSKAGRGLVVVGAAVVVLIGCVGGAVYTVQAIPNRADDRLIQTDPTLNTYAQVAHVDPGLASTLPMAGDYEAITWLRENLNGKPTLLEASTQVPGVGGRISALTGYPCVLGVVSVENQQRPGMERMTAWRQADVTAVFAATGGWAGIEPILQDYGVQVIYIGQLERQQYGDGLIQVLQQAAAEGHVRELYNANGVVIYSYSGARVSREYQP